MTGPYEASQTQPLELQEARRCPVPAPASPPPSPPSSPPSHLGGEGSCLPIVIQHLVTAQAVIVNDVPFDRPEEVRHFVFYQPGLARKKPSSIPCV